MSDSEKQQQQSESTDSPPASEKKPDGPKFVYAAFSAAAWIILVHELLERFSFYGTKGILTYYLHDFLRFDADTSTIIYHLFTGISYLMPLLGTYMSDNFLGRFKTIVILGVVYLIGHALMPITALWRNIPGPLIAMFVLTIGTGGIKPCVAAFGGDQIEPGNELVLDAFFSVFYMCINIGAFVSQLITPILREQVKCIENSCYPLGFGVPAFAFLLCYILFLVGTPKYKIFPKPESPMLNRAIGVIFSGKLWRKEGGGDEKETEEDRAFLHDVRQAVQVCFLFLPLPIYWALFDQQGSRWVLQGKRMDGYVSEGFSITADQMQSVNPLLIVIVLPIFNNIIYPLFAKCNLLKSATSRIFWGYIVCSAAFCVTGIVEVVVDGTMPEQLPANQAQLRMFNGNPCPVTVEFDGRTAQVPAYTVETFNDWRISLPADATEVEYLRVTGVCANSGRSLTVRLTLQPASENLVVVHGARHSLPLPVPVVGGSSRLRAVFSEADDATRVNFGARDGDCLPAPEMSNSSSHLPSFGYCEISSRQDVPMRINDETEADAQHRVPMQGGIKFATVFVHQYANGTRRYFNIEDRLLTPPHILLQLPQYVLMCTSEVLTSVTALAYAYSEAPECLKALLQSAYLVCIFFGNMIVIAVAALPRMPRQSYEFFLFAGLVFIGGFVQLLVIFYYLKMRAKNSVRPVDVKMEVVGDETKIEGKSNPAFAAIEDEKAVGAE